MKKILITTGGTGGHVIPATIIDEHLKDSFQIYYSTDFRGSKYLSKHVRNIVIFDTPRLNLNIFLPLNLLKIIFLIFKSAFFLKKEKIEKVISIGGYMSIPVIISAKILGLTIFLLEPNFVLGRGNKFFLNFSKKIFCYSKKIDNFPKKDFHKIELIKPLVSRVFYDQKQNDYLNKKFCFLISGGSQGAKIFDELLKEVIMETSKYFSIKVIQQTSTENIDELKRFYDSQNIENIIFDFKENFFDLINISDLCITRAGATSLAEISFLNKPFIAIPLPTAKDNHQMKNAQFYEQLGCCWILDQNNISKESILNILIDILKNKSTLNLKKTNLKRLNSNNSWKDTNKKLKRVINEN